MSRFRRYGRLGLIGLAARTAIVSGIASAVSSWAARLQQDKAPPGQEHREYHGPQHAPPATAATLHRPALQAETAQPDFVDSLQKLTELHAQGALTEAEFAAAKTKLLS